MSAQQSRAATNGAQFNRASSAAALLAEHNERAVQLALQEKETLLRVHTTRNSQRPNATQLLYSPKALEFVERMKSVGYTDELVSESKMVLFLTTIQNRPVRKRGRKRKSDTVNSASRFSDGDTTVSSDDPVIGHSTLAAYVNVIMDLWRLQRSLGSNTRQPIRPNIVKEILKQKKVAAVQQELNTFQDAGEKMMVDATFGDATVQKIVDEMFNSGTEDGLRHRVDVLLSLGLSSCGDNIQRLCLPHIGLITYDNEGVCGASLLRTVWKKSKKNQYLVALQRTAWDSILRRHGSTNVDFRSGKLSTRQKGAVLLATPWSSTTEP